MFEYKHSMRINKRLCHNKQLINSHFYLAKAFDFLAIQIIHIQPPFIIFFNWQTGQSLCRICRFWSFVSSFNVTTSRIAPHPLQV